MHSPKDESPLAKAYVRSAHRTRAPADTLAAYAPLMGRLGITRLANITGLDCIGVPVVVAVRPTSRGLATSQGKGLDLPSAKASALMEAIETWHAERIVATTRVDTFEELRRAGEAIDARGLQRRAGRSLRPGTPLAWVCARALASGSPCWVPWEAVSCDFSASVVRNATFLQHTNGLSSGNHVLEAIVHGLCEVIERDAVTLHQLGTRALRAERRVDLSTIEDVRVRGLLDELRDAGVDVALWDATSDLGVPVFSALIVDSPAAARWRALGSFRGHGCHPSPEIAVIRAVTEAVQSRLTYISGSRDDLFPERYRVLQRKEAAGLHGDELAIPGARRFSTCRPIDHTTFDADLADILARLEGAGLTEAAVFDLTRADVGVPVVKVLVPGLENDLHGDRNYRPGPRAQRARARFS